MISGPQVIRQGMDYNFTVSAQNIKKSVRVDFKLAGYDISNRYYEWNILDEKISNNELEWYSFDVSLNQNL